MRILYSVHLYLPEHAAGGEMYLHNIAKFLISKGNQVRVLLMDSAHYGITEMYSYEGVEIFPTIPGRDITPLYHWCDVVITHLQYAAHTFHLADVLRKPAIFVSHNTWMYDVVNQFQHHGVIYNSNAMKGLLEYKNPSFVLHPPIKKEKYDFGGPTGDHITLVNMNANKGGRLFMAIASAMQDRKFLGVGGGYDNQWGRPLPNLTMWENSPDMERVYRATRILLMPSKYESWGMCATEAMCNGIPVIYHPTFGLCENVGPAGIQVKDQNHDFEDTEVLKGGEHPGLDPEANMNVWIKAIKSLDDPKKYKKYSTLSRQRATDLDPSNDLEQLEQFIYGHIQRSGQLYADRAGNTNRGEGMAFGGLLR